MLFSEYNSGDLQLKVYTFPLGLRQQSREYLACEFIEDLFS